MYLLRLGIPLANRSDQLPQASFLVIGDWGWDDVAHGNIQSRACQNLIADSMHEAFLELGDVKFVINAAAAALGDVSAVDQKKS